MPSLEETGTAEDSGGDVDYAIYEAYGLAYAGNDSYNLPTYAYNGNIVRFFYDPVAKAGFTNYYTGIVDIEPIYDENNHLVGIRECSKEKYDKHTKKYESFGKHYSLSDSETIEGSAESGDSESMETLIKKMEEYEAYGIIYNAQDNRWYYCGESIRALIDSGKSTVYLNEDGVLYITVSRNDDHSVSGLKIISQEEAQTLMQDIRAGGFDSTVQSK